MTLAAARPPSHLSERGLLFLAGWEGLRLLPYNDAGGNATIGYGHLLHAGPVVQADREAWAFFGELKARRLLRVDVGVAELAVVRDVVPPIQLQHRFDALVSFVFNVGTSAFRHSTLLRELNAGHRDRRAADQLLRWDRAGGRVIAGLERRRRAEAELFLHGSYALS